MDRTTTTMTVSVRGLSVAALALLALVTAYLLGDAGGTTAPAAQAAPAAVAGAAEQPRTLRMVGSGETRVVPDQLAFTLSVTDKQPELEQALDNSSATMKRVLDRLQELGVRPADVQTTGLEMHPEYDYPAYSPPVLTGYRVTQRAEVRVRELAQGGNAVSTAVETGGNGVRVTGIRLGLSDPEAALGEARDAAVAEAEAKAEQYAGATGQELGAVLALRELGGSAGHRDRVVDQLAAYRSAADALKEVPIRAGKDRLAVRVQVVWELEPAAAE